MNKIREADVLNIVALYNSLGDDFVSILDILRGLQEQGKIARGVSMFSPEYKEHAKRVRSILIKNGILKNRMEA